MWRRMISTHILEGHAFEMIRETMLDPERLRGCLEKGASIRKGSPVSTDGVRTGTEPTIATS
jgi:hypothetical protein